jgi:uncharacterized protein (TIGR00369 family)
VSRSTPTPTSSTAVSGLDRMLAIIAGTMPFAPIAEVMDFRLVEASEGFVAIEGMPHSRFYNPHGAVHGGWALTLIDSVTGCAGHTLLPQGTGYTTLETKTNFVRAIMAETGPVRAEGRVLASGRRIITAEGRITDANGRLLAHGGSTLLVLPPPA